MGFEIFIYILRWVTELIGKICDLPPAHPSSYFMTSPLRLLHTTNVRFSLLDIAQRILGVTLPNFL